MLSLWWITFLCLGILCFILLATLIYKSQSKWLKFKNYPAASDLIDYALLLEDNVVLLKSGGLMSMYAIELPDLTMQPQSRINHIYELAQNALLKLDGHYCIHIDMIRSQNDEYVPFLETDHPVLQDIENRRIRKFKEQGCFHSQLFLSITQMGDNNTDRYLEELLVSTSSDSATPNLNSNLNAAYACAANASASMTHLNTESSKFNAFSNPEQSSDTVMSSPASANDSRTVLSTKLSTTSFTASHTTSSNSAQPQSNVSQTSAINTLATDNTQPQTAAFKHESCSLNSTIQTDSNLAYAKNNLNAANVDPRALQIINSFKQACQNVVDALQEVFIVRPLTTSVIPQTSTSHQIPSYTPDSAWTISSNLRSNTPAYEANLSNKATEPSNHLTAHLLNGQAINLSHSQATDLSHKNESVSNKQVHDLAHNQIHEQVHEQLHTQQLNQPQVTAQATKDLPHFPCTELNCINLESRWLAPQYLDLAKNAKTVSVNLTETVSVDNATHSASTSVENTETINADTAEHTEKFESTEKSESLDVADDGSSITGENRHAKSTENLEVNSASNGEECTEMLASNCITSASNATASTTETTTLHVTANTNNSAADTTAYNFSIKAAQVIPTSPYQLSYELSHLKQDSTLLMSAGTSGSVRSDDVHPADSTITPSSADALLHAYVDVDQTDNKEGKLTLNKYNEYDEYSDLGVDQAAQNTVSKTAHESQTPQVLPYSLDPQTAHTLHVHQDIQAPQECEKKTAHSPSTHTGKSNSFHSRVCANAYSGNKESNTAGTGLNHTHTVTPKVYSDTSKAYSDYSCQRPLTSLAAKQMCKEGQISNEKTVGHKGQICYENPVHPEELKDKAEQTPSTAQKFYAGQISHEGLSFLHRCLTGKSHAIALPCTPVYLDSLLCTEDYIHGMTPQIGRQHICVLAINGLPRSSTQGLLDRLSQLPFACRFSTRFVYLNLLESQKMLNQYRRLWSQKAKSLIAQFMNIKSSRVNQNAINKVSEIDNAQRALDNHELIFGSYTANLILMHEDLQTLQMRAAEAIKAIESLGFGVRIETVNATEAFLGSLPGHYYENLRRSIISQDVLADLIPVSAPVLGEKEAPCPLYGSHRSPLMQVRTAGLSSYLLNLHDQDLGNTLVVGPPGSGKSVLLGELILNLLRYQQMQVFAFDHSYSFFALTRALGGVHKDLQDHTPQLCPLSDLNYSRGFDHALSFLITLYELNHMSLSPMEHHELASTLQLLQHSQLSRSLSQLHILLNSTRLKNGLMPYLSSQDAPSLLDGSCNMELNSLLTTFECKELLNAPPQLSVLVLKQLFYLLERSFTGTPAAIVLDEAWLMLQHPVFSHEVIKWFKTLRKHNVIVILATQSLSDLEHSSEFSNLIECTKTRIYLANHAAENLPAAKAYSRLGLSPQEIHALTHAHAKRDYLFVKGEQRIMFNLMLSPEELRLLSFSGEQGRERAESLYRQYGPAFYTYQSA